MVKKDENPYKFSNNIDLIIGMTSVLLVELKLIGYDVISFQPTINKQPIIKFGYGIKIINNYNDLLKINIQKQKNKNRSNYHFKALDNILEIINY